MTHVATSTVTNRLLANLLLNFENDIHIDHANDTGERTGKEGDKERLKLYFIKFKSKVLPENCVNTHVDIFIKFPELGFRRDCDV